MEKSKHNYTISSGIPTSELMNFINPVKMSLSVDKDCYYKVFDNHIELRESVNKYYEHIFEHLSTMPAIWKPYFIDNYCTFSYVSHTNGYDFRFSPIDFVNSLFRFLNLEYEIPFVNLDNGYGMNYLKDYVRAYVNDFKRDESKKSRIDYKQTEEVLSQLSENLDDIVDMYYTSLDRLINDNVRAKTMLLYLAFKSLSEYEKTKDDVYMVLPFEYYQYVSHMRTSPWPHTIHFNNRWVSYMDFRTKYEGNIDPNKYVDDNPFILDDHEVLLAIDLLTPGMLERDIRDVCERTRAQADVDYDKYMKLFEVKMNYYMKSPYIKYIKGKYGLLGYIGFSYKNDYLLFDKFHNSDTIDPSKKTILTHGEAIYALPADRFDILGSKQRVIAAKQSDYRIKKINHTPNYSFIDKLDAIIQGPNVSTLPFDEALENAKKRILVNKKHSM